ncbi:tautomerase family protein [Nocardia sp. NBC_00508]|uniref:tautomerase family protein n=1 Tax=Nocardia sp. NBC_00508 TaxID=2975992 RepID=UPI002E81AF75|nr:tautomerase family protein [Nocardia sp. NBC_00508]WUD65863.1 tautomerase family protein [Nocardia sp. NBC_00508]
MPLVRIDWLPGRGQEQKRELSELITRELARIGQCTLDSVTVIFRDVAPGDWAEGGTLLEDRR